MRENKYRENKYRGKSKYNDKWYYGNLIDCHDDDVYIAETYDVATFELVDPETVGQFVGIPDKNEVEIYEGDIVKTKYHELRDFGDEIADYYAEFVEEVVWLPLHNGFGLKLMIDDIPLYRPLDFVTETNGIKLIELEVIGNIYDNPELLKGE